MPMIPPGTFIVWMNRRIEIAAVCQPLAVNPPKRVRFAVAGTPDPGNPASISQRQLDEWKQTNRVEWWGWQDDMPAALAQTDIFCLPSYREGVPNALLEAMAAGLPVVAPSIDRLPTLVGHDREGLLYAPGTPGALAAALERLTDPALRQRLGGAARERAIRDYSWDAHCRALDAAIRGIRSRSA